MIPILFPPEETEFTTNGLGRLTDSISCRVTEELNGQFECVLEYPVSGKRFSDIAIGVIIFATHDDGRIPQPFDIYRMSRPMNGVVKVYARHISYRTSNIIMKPFQASGAAGFFAKLGTQAINNNPFTYISTVSASGSVDLTGPYSARYLMCGEGDMCVPKLYKGEYEWDMFTIKHTARRGRETSIELRYAKNITDLRHDIDGSSTYTAVVPFWRSGDGGTLVMLPEKIVVKTGETADRAGILDLSHEFDEAPTETALRNAANRALNESDVLAENFEVKFFELWNTEEYEEYSALQRAYLGDTVKVTYQDYGINTEVRVIKKVYDTLLDRYESMGLGEPQKSFASSIMSAVGSMISQASVTQDMMKSAIGHASQLITGGSGGNVVIRQDANGKPTDILIMDNADINSAVNVLRLNVNGIGFSSTGYAGPYTSAWTLDGAFVADFITAGALNAARVSTGILQGHDGKNTFDLDNDAVQLELNTLSIVAAPTVEGGSWDTYTIGEASLYTMLQADLFDKLTDNGNIDGIFMDQGQLYINMSYLKTGTIRIEDPLGNPTFVANSLTGDIDINANTLTVGGQTIAQIAGTTYLYYDATNGLVISEAGGASGSSALPYNIQFLGSGINFRNRTTALMALTTSGMVINASNGNRRMELGANDLTFYKKNGTTEVASIGDNGLNVKTGIIGGFTADTNSLSTSFMTANREYVVQILRPTSASGRMISIQMLEHDSSDPDSPISNTSEMAYVKTDGESYFRTLASGGPGSVFDDYIQLNDGTSGYISGSMKMGRILTDSYNLKFTGMSSSGSGNHLTIQTDGSVTIGPYVTSSSRRYKEHVRDMSYDDAKGILQITPVMFRFKKEYLPEDNELSGKTIPGFYAEDVEEQYPEAASHHEGKVENWMERHIIPPMLRIIQEQQKEITSLKERLARLEDIVARMTA